MPYKGALVVPVMDENDGIKNQSRTDMDSIKDEEIRLSRSIPSHSILNNSSRHSSFLSELCIQDPPFQTPRVHILLGVLIGMQASPIDKRALHFSGHRWHPREGIMVKKAELHEYPEPLVTHSTYLLLVPPSSEGY